MRWIVGITLTLICLGWIACQIDTVSAGTGQPRAADGWRRTTKGWERLVSFKQPAAPTGAVAFWRLHPHPLLATLLLVMLSVLMLVAFTEGAISDAGPRKRVVANHGCIGT